MTTDLPMSILALIVAGGIALHVLLAVAARYANPVILMTGMFFALAPWAAVVLPGVEVLKFGRLYLTVLAVVVSVLFMRAYKLNLSGFALLFLMTFYWIAGVWSDQPWGAIQFKGLALPALVMGLFAASNLRSRHDVIVAMRVFTLFSLFFAGPAFVELLVNGIGLARGGRFAPWGLNANRLGHECASMLIAATAVALYDKSWSWKAFAYIVGTMAAACILASGSRAAAGQAAIGAIIMGLPLFKRPLLPLTFGTLAAVILWYLMPEGTDDAYGRFSDIQSLHREGEWTNAFNIFRENPLWGAGWVYTDMIRLSGSTANMHSIYFQFLAETGIAGVLILFITLAILGWQYLNLWRYARHTGFDQRMVFLGAAFALTPLAHGFAESSTIMSGTINLVMMGLGFAMIGSLRDIATAEAAQAAEQAWHDAEAAEDEAHDEFMQERQRFAGYGAEPRTA